MDNNQKITPEKITKPIQLLAAWLIGLILIDTSFLFTASAMENGSWERGLLIVASALNVPLFLFSIFLLQTKFRPEMQEDSFYSKYLESKTGEKRKSPTENELSNLREELFSANNETLELISALQGEIKELSFEVKGGTAKVIVSERAPEIEQKIQKATESSAWNQYEVRINRLIPDVSDFKVALTKANIPIHSAFGNDSLDLHLPVQIVIGPGFTIERIRQFLNAISELDVGVIAFAYPDDEESTYEREILIGAYNNHTYGLTLDEATSVVNSEGIDVDVFYSAISH